MDLFGTQQNSSILTPRMIRIAAVVVTVIIALLIVWYLYTHRSKEVEVDGPFDLRNDAINMTEDDKWLSVFDAEQTQLASGNNITLSFFVYVKDITMDRIPVNYDGSYRFQYLLTIGNIIGVMMDPVKQQCIIDVLQTPPHGFRTTNVEQKSVVLRTTTMQKVPVSRWNQVTICVEGRSVDLYLNGELNSSIQLDNLPSGPMNGVLLNSSPDFVGQACLFQMWPQRRTGDQVRDNYRRNTDVRGRPDIPEPGLSVWTVLSKMKVELCNKTGFCFGDMADSTTALDYVEYQFA